MRKRVISLQNRRLSEQSVERDTEARCAVFLCFFLALRAHPRASLALWPALTTPVPQAKELLINAALPYYLRCLILAFHPRGSIRKWCNEVSILFIVKLVLGGDQKSDELFCFITRHQPTQPHYELSCAVLRWCYKSG